ncbi:hypothetical protein [Longimicrobium sp.]|uniref:hypothetical protein n=1 Tax=Longimicrobium sp. TaxID=2029185 RepID=UPI002E306D23|nr:hypothetical protein [Longimicrobium sp.]HEX6042325.1 hypothetical protein [Longimicrobium sp.]
MKNWTEADARERLGEVIRRAERCGPQRVEGPNGNGVVLSEGDFVRILADAGLDEAELCCEGGAPDGEPVSFVEFMRQSPLAEAMRSGEWPWEWDDTTRTWVLPGDAVPA